MCKYLRTALLLLVAACMLSSLDLSAKVKPQWVLNGEEQMNRKRISDNYVFKVFHTFSPDLGQLKDERFEPLMDYVRETYGAERLSMRLDSVTVAGSPVTYRVSFRDSSGDASVYARLADSYTSFEDFVDNEYGYEFYQKIRGYDVYTSRYALLLRPARLYRMLLSSAGCQSPPRAHQNPVHQHRQTLFHRLRSPGSIHTFPYHLP